MNYLSPQVFRCASSSPKKTSTSSGILLLLLNLWTPELLNPDASSIQGILLPPLGSCGSCCSCEPIDITERMDLRTAWTEWRYPRHGVPGTTWLSRGFWGATGTTCIVHILNIVGWLVWRAHNEKKYNPPFLVAYKSCMISLFSLYSV